MKNHFDVIVVGGGHAGTEAAMAASRMGMETLLLTQSMDTLGQMSCNPAIGGIGKGHLVKEVDALGGIMAKAIDASGIQFRILNARKGPAVRATRAQADRMLYRQYIRGALENQKKLSIFQQNVEDIIMKNHAVVGVVTQMGLPFYASAVILTVGTFLGGRIHIGKKHFSGGRAGDAPSIALAEKLRALPFRVDRLKTGTPPRIDGKTVNFSQMIPQPGDEPVPVFSYIGHASEHPKQVPCFITHTNAKTHEVIRKGLDSSPIFSGAIQGVGPRYCPSIEDKIHRFSDKDSHQIFVEPEGLMVQELYPNGISTSLAFETQIAFVRTIKGFENAHITRPGYAIEYDFFDPRDLNASLETKCVEGLFFAGQINGTTGYEEAAAQGLMAGVNAALKVQKKAPFILPRHLAYTGVLIDDLITKGTKEPYRMFTSRAEHRLMLREDNADMRLTALGKDLGLIEDTRWRAFLSKKAAVEHYMSVCKRTFMQPGDALSASIQHKLKDIPKHEYSYYDLLRRPEIGYKDLGLLDADQVELALEQVEIHAKYEGYIERQQQDVSRIKRFEGTSLPKDLDYRQITGLSSEVIEKLESVRPETLGQASRIPGITPAATSLLMVYLKKHARLIA